MDKTTKGTRAVAGTTDTEKKSFREQLGALKNLPKFFRLIWDTSKRMTIANMVLRLIKSALPITMLYIGKLIIDEVIRLIDVVGERELSYLWLLVALELGLAVLSDLINRGITLMDSLLGDLFSNRTSVTLIEHAATLDLAQFEDATFYDKLERARRQTVSRVVLMSQVLSQLQDIVTIAFLAAGLIAFNPWLLLILLIAVVPSFLGESHFNERTYSLSRSWTPERRELDYLRYIGASDETVMGVITVGSLTFLAGSFSSMRSLLQGIMTRFSQIAESALYLQDLFDFLELKPMITPPANPLPLPRPIQKGFTFENVGFKYHNSERWAVRYLSFHLKAGEKLALVGENGAGKTTLVKLLARLYEPSEGRILLDGIDLRDYDLANLRHQVGIIFQDYVRFQMTASDNIAIGQISNILDKERIQGSAQKSLADLVIQRLPDKYDQVLGKRFNKGVELSGGEWQKVALARAYMRDAQLLILDEPTSALDARAEHEVFLRFSELIEGRTAVLISHRFSTVRMADRILFLEQGQLKELGSHEELLAKNGKYAELFLLQAKGYL